MSNPQSVKATWRGYLYISFGLGFGVYRGLKVVEWTAWDYFDQFVAIAAVLTGIIALLKK